MAADGGEAFVAVFLVETIVEHQAQAAGVKFDCQGLFCLELQKSEQLTQNAQATAFHDRCHLLRLTL